jgi:antirestriction protein ArdC
MANSVYQIVTEKIIAQLEQGVAPWQKPWQTDVPMNLISQKEYRGLNVFLLASQGYSSRYWLTYAQASKLGGNVKRGEHGSTVVFWKFDKYDSKDADGETTEKTSAILRYYTVFNLEQTEGIADKLGLTSNAARVPNIEACDQIVSQMPNPPAREQSDRAWYRPSTDCVGMPAKDAFNSPEAYYATLFHELTHSTGHRSRVGRDGIENLNEFGSESYSKEELVAELGASMLCGVTGISPAVIQNSAAYLQCWIERLKGDSKLIVSAASSAQKAADYIRAIRTESAGKAGA